MNNWPDDNKAFLDEEEDEDKATFAVGMASFPDEDDEDEEMAALVEGKRW